MKRLLGLGTIIVTAAAALSAMSPNSAVAEPGSMVLIGVGLLLSASLARRRFQSRG